VIDDDPGRSGASIEGRPGFQRLVAEVGLGKVGLVRLYAIEACVPRDLDVHLVWDNYATHKTTLIREWLAKRPRWHVHLTPTRSSWLNQVERFFAMLTEKQIRPGVHRSVTCRATIKVPIDRSDAAMGAFWRGNILPVSRWPRNGTQKMIPVRHRNVMPPNQI
jgi:hypothetical protein